MHLPVNPRNLTPSWRFGTCWEMWYNVSMPGLSANPEKRAKQLANLTKPFVKGQPSANPSGRPAAARDFRQRCRDFMELKGWSIIERLANEPGRDQIRAAELISAYAYGKPPQKLEHGGDPEGVPITYHEIVLVASEAEKGSEAAG